MSKWAAHTSCLGYLSTDINCTTANISLGFSLRSPYSGQDAEPSKPLVADDKVLEGAKVHLLHKHDRPYFFGIDLLCDAGSENAEQFLQLAARLVAQSETQLIRSKSPTLTAARQHALLRERAAEMIREWDFPHHQQVRRICDPFNGLWTDARDG